LNCFDQTLKLFQVAKEAHDIPHGWRLVTFNDALKNLREMYTIQEDSSSDSETG
jgi:hypothetical protein